jgi:hypothetical protein
MLPAEIPITFFTDYAAQRKREERVTPTDLAHRISTMIAPEKTRLPWLKLGRFGSARSDKGSLRHDANMSAISGIEADYDGFSRRWRIVSPKSHEFVSYGIINVLPAVKHECLNTMIVLVFDMFCCSFALTRIGHFRRFSRKMGQIRLRKALTESPTPPKFDERVRRFRAGVCKFHQEIEVAIVLVF